MGLAAGQTRLFGTSTARRVMRLKRNPFEMPSKRIAEKWKKAAAAETATHFLVKWDEEEARYSVVKRELIVSEPPWLIGSRVAVKAPDRKGHVPFYEGEIVSKGSRASMETSLNRIIDDSAKRDSACLSSTPVSKPSDLKSSSLSCNKSAISKSHDIFGGKTGVVTDKSKMILVDEEVSSEEVEHAEKSDLNGYRDKRSAGVDGHIPKKRRMQGEPQECYEERCFVKARQRKDFDMMERYNLQQTGSVHQEQQLIQSENLSPESACLEKQYEEELLKKFKSSIASSLNQKCREAKDGLVKEQREKEVKRMMETTLHTKTHAPRSLYLGTPVKINQLQEQDDEDDTENDNEEEKEE